MQSRWTVALGVFCWAFCSAGLAEVATYRVTDLGGVVASDINASGQVVGWRANAPAPPTAFLWTSGSGMQNISTMNYAVSINASGQIVGFNQTPGGPRAALWTFGSGTQQLIPEEPFKMSTAYDINDSGQIVGEIGNRAFLWTSGVVQYLGVHPGVYPNQSTTAVGVNASGQIAGYGYPSIGSGGTAFRWTNESGMQDLGDLPEGEVYSRATGINDSGQVIGYSKVATDSRAFVWTSGLGMRNIGSLGGFYDRSSAYGINANGQVVGTSFSSAGDSAFVWTLADGMLDLNNHLDASTEGGWRLERANAINDLGQIVGVGQSHGFLLTPVIAPSAPVTYTMPPPSGGNPVNPPLVPIDSMLSVDFPATDGGDFTATFREMTPAQAQMDLSSFNFVIPGETLQAWDLHFDGDLLGQSVRLEFHYDDTGMLSSLEQWLTVYHFVDGQAVPLPTISRDTANNIITVSTDGFSTFALGSPLGVPEPGSLAMLLGLALTAVLYGRRRHV